MRLTEDLPDMEVVSIEWPDEDVPCVQCPRLAVWWRDCSSCGNTVWVCESHRIRSDQWVARQTGRVGCERCRVEFPRPIPPWKPLR